MRRPKGTRGTGSVVLGVALLAAMLMLAAGTSYADREQGRGSGQGWRVKGSGGERTRTIRGERAYQDRGGRPQRGEWASRSEPRYKGDGGRIRGGTWDRAYRGGTRTYRGGDVRAYRGRGGRDYVESRRVYSGAPYYRGGVSSYYYYGDPTCRTPVRYRYVRPRSYVSIGIGLGLPYYCPPTYRYRIAPHPVVESYRSSIDVENLPPAGCYYFDRFCDRQFSDLDSYTDHIDHEGHEQTIEILYTDSGDWVRTLEFVDGYWVVQR